MRNFKRTLGGIVLWGIAAITSAAPIADSAGGFSPTQGQNGWTYGFFDAGPAPGANYAVGGFVQFDTFDAVDNRWEASSAQVSTGNNVFLSVDVNGGHPTGIGPDAQDSIIWAVRRYTSATAGLVDVSYVLRKRNTGNPNGGGITGHLFVDGVALLDQFIANADGVGVQNTLAILVNAGSFIDLAIDPTGLTSARDPSIHNARADGTDFMAVITTHAAPVPEPGELALMLAGLALTGVMVSGRNRRMA